MNVVCSDGHVDEWTVGQMNGCRGSCQEGWVLNEGMRQMYRWLVVVAVSVRILSNLPLLLSTLLQKHNITTALPNHLESP